MIEINKLILKDVRCFEGRKEFNIRPLTFLVGENSTGKSTALGCFQALSDFMSLRGFLFYGHNIDFNNEPYQMGAFSDIARKTQSFSKKFELGFEIGEVEYTFILVAREGGSEPILEKISTNFPDGKIVIEIDRSKKRKNLKIKEEKGNKFNIIVNADKVDLRWLMTHRSFQNSLFDIYAENKEEKNLKTSSAFKNLLDYLGKDEKRRYRGFQLGGGYSGDIRTYSFAPIRSKPERTYNPLKETASPEGSEMPMVLMNLSTSEQSRWQELKTKLENFGKASGLFTDIRVRKLGRSSMSDPFQLQIKVRGPRGNIVDVGYGISQILPILVRILTTRRSTRFLLQQPEVHLHPKGQAELVSLLIDMAKNSDHVFIVETHSEAMINRARIEIMEGGVKPKDISLIYLEPEGNKVKVHNISFDKKANMIGVPDSYGDFFLQEHEKLLGFGE